MTNERDPKFFDIYRYDSKTYTRTLFYKNKDGYFPGRVSDDEKWIALDKPNTTNDSDVFVWNVATKQVTHITKHTGNANNASQQFDRASQHLLLPERRERRVHGACGATSLADGKVEDVERRRGTSWRRPSRITASTGQRRQR